MDVKIFRINYKSDFILTLNSDAGWMTPFCIKFWTGAPSQAYFVGFDGTTYTHCAPVDGEPTKLLVQFDDHNLPIGDLKFQIGYHFTVADFPTSVEDEVVNQASVIIEVDDVPAQVMLDLNGETAPEIEFSLPAYANEAQRIANEEQRIANEEQRIANEEARIAAETIRQQNEAQRISNEESRVTEFARLKQESETATADANAAAALANEKAALADDKAALADAAATLANEKAQLAADKAALAQAAATLANEKAALAQQKAAYAQTQGDYAKAQGDYAKEQGEIAEEDHERAEADHTRAESDHTQATSDHTQAGTDHSTAVNDHTQSVTDHTQADTDHTRAESDHTQAASDHTQTGADHTRAESDHTTASADHTQAGQDHTRAESDHTRAESDHAAVEVYVDSLGAFDISAYHATGGVLDKYADLAAALGTNGANIPDALRKGGMSVKYVQSSDNNYVQWRLVSKTFSTDPNDWVAENEDFRNEVMQEVNEAIASINPIEITGDVTNAPDEHDLTSVNIEGTDVLRFKDKDYAPLIYSGMGRTYQRKNIVNGVNVMTQDMFYKGEVGSRVPNTNTIFLIQYDYDLNGQTITIPDGCVLMFDGGSLKNGTIVASATTYIDADKKVFDNVTLLGKIANSCVRLSWFCNENDDAADVLTNLLSINVPEIFIDLTVIKISHPIAPNDSYGFSRPWSKRIYGLSGTFRHGNMTTIVPTSDYSANGYERNSVLFYADTCYGLTVDHLNIEGQYKFGYFFYCKNYATVTIERCRIIGCAVSAIKLSGTEHTYIKHNVVHDCGAFILAYPYIVNETNVLDMSGQIESNTVINLLKVEDNYVGESNYGIVAQIGSDIEINKNCISYISCYALYLNGERNINIFENYFEGCGGGTFWVDYNGKEESSDNSIICEHLLHPDGSSTEVGWGIQAFRNKLMRPVIYLWSGISNRKASCFVSGNNFSCNYCRTTLDKIFDVNGANTVSISSAGIDCIFYFQNVNVELNSTFVGPGSSDFNHIAKYFIAMKNESVADRYTGKIIIDYLPYTYRNVLGWCYGLLGYSNDSILVLRQDRKQTNINYDTPINVLENYDDALSTAKTLSSLCPFNLIKDGINFYSLPNDGKISYIIPISAIGAVPVDVEDTFIDYFLYNPTNANLYYYTKIYIVYGTSRTAINNISIMNFGSQSSPITIGPGEKVKLTDVVNLLRLKFTGVFTQVLINLFALEDSGNTKIATNKLLVSDVYRYNINCSPNYIINYSKEYDRFGRLIRGDSASRPSNVESGFQYFDTSLSPAKPIYWNGTAWVDATGTAVL